MIRRYVPGPSCELRKSSQLDSRRVAMRPCSSGQDPVRRGVVLIIVLVLVVMIALAGFGFVAEMTTEYEAAKINGDLLQAEQVMASAEAFLLAHVDRLEQPLSVRGAGQTASAPVVNFQAVALESSPGGFGSSGQRPADTEWRFAVIRDLSQFDATLQRRQFSVVPNDIDPDGDLEFARAPEFGLTNESAKLNLGRVLYWDSVEPGRGRQALLHIPGMTDEAADSILDWIDADDIPRQFGAEADDYRQQLHNIQPRNSLPETLAELLYVRGVSRHVFYGDPGLTESEATAGWEQYLTLTSAETPRSVSEKIALVELNPSDLETLEEDLAQSLSPEYARYVVLALMFGTSPSGATSTGSASVPAGVASTINPLAVDMSSVTAESGVAAIELSDLIDSSVVLPVPGRTLQIRSPFRSDDPDSLRSFASLEQQLTSIDTTLPMIRGRINLLEAGEDVLRALTDDPAIASQIVQQRESLSDDERTSSVWLLSRRIMDITTYRKLYPDITTGGNVYSGEIIVYRRTGGPFLRRKITIGAANGSARRLNWQDKSSLPLPLTLEQLEPVNGFSSDD
ncbi:MAG: general secretion pathway protein GspK [Planctomycetaceae bacterium]|nr:general secretion pathway protein GspK [Planctomycetaceae bacterium]